MSTFTGLEIINKSKGKLPRLPFDQMKETILGKKYELSLVFIRASEIKKLNKIYRNIDTATDILSFPLDTQGGEMFICLTEAKKEAVKFDRSFENFLAFLFIHGLVHLKGYDHGRAMEKLEIKYQKKFKI